MSNETETTTEESPLKYPASAEQLREALLASPGAEQCERGDFALTILRETFDTEARPGAGCWFTMFNVVYIESRAQFLAGVWVATKGENGNGVNLYRFVQ